MNFMKDNIIINIGKLVQVENLAKLKKSGDQMSSVEFIDNAYLIYDNKIVDFGKMTDLKHKLSDFKQIHDAENGFVYPSFCDSHTHLVYAGSREIEYVDKIKGLSYEEIAKRGGGILNSAKLLNQTDENQLYIQAKSRIDEIISQGTGAVEIKSGYGLTLQAELKMLRVIKKLKENCPIIIKSTFLAAHAVPLEYKNRQSEYVDYVVNEMIPFIGEQKLADYIDVFCDKGFFTVEETEKMLEEGKKYDLIPKIHANELDFSGGVQTGVKFGALSVDHLEYVGDSEIEALLNSQTMPTILPGAAFFLNLPYAPARKMISSGLPVAVASDFNPGSSPSGNMKLMMSFAMVNHRMTAQEALNATTINTAYAMGISDIAGSIAKNKIANFYITEKMPNIEFFPYSYGSNLIKKVFLKGEIINNNK